jgi:hypothetical protein
VAAPIAYGVDLGGGNVQVFEELLMIVGSGALEFDVQRCMSASVNPAERIMVVHFSLVMCLLAPREGLVCSSIRMAR